MVEYTVMFKPDYTITPRILSAISEISEIKTIVERSRVLPLNEAQLKRQAVARMAHTSTSIEGNPLAQFQVDKVLSGMSVNADKKSVQEIKNYQQAILEMEKMVEDKKELTIERILQIHSVLMKDLLEGEKTGHFRKGPVYIVDDLGDGREKLRFVGPDSKKLAFLINELLVWLKHAGKESLHPVLKAGIFHSQFVHIHAFADGNGRITRLLTQYLLYREGWDFRKIIVLEDYYNRDRQGYYNGLASGWDEKYASGADFSPWLEYFCKGFLVEARKVAEQISSIGFGKAADSKSQVYLDPGEVKIMDFLTTTGRITSHDVQEILGVAKRTAQLKLKNLVGKDLIRTQGAGPSTYYILRS